MLVPKGSTTKKRGKRLRTFAYGYEVCPQCNQRRYELEWYWWRTVAKNRVPIERKNGGKDQSKRLVCSHVCRECYRQNLKVRLWRRELSPGKAGSAERPEKI